MKTLSFLSILLLVVVSFVFSQTDQFKISVDPAGIINFGGLSIQLVISETGNRPTFQDTRSVKATPGFPKGSKGNFEFLGSLIGNATKNAYPFKLIVKQSENNINLSWIAENLGSDVLDIRMAIRLDAATFQGTTLSLGSQTVVLPANAGNRFLIGNRTIPSLILPTENGQLNVSSDSLIISLQDLRTVRQDFFEIRIAINRDGSTASAQFVFSPPGTEKSSVPSVSTPLLSWEIYPSVKVLSDIPFLGPGRAEKMDIYIPSPIDSSVRVPSVLVIHGGGWIGGDKADGRERQICETFAKAGFVAVSVNYLIKRKATLYPTNIHDIKTAIRYLRVYASQININPEKMGVIGGSAGGHLAMLMAWSGDNPKLDPVAFPGVSTHISAVINLYGVPDLRIPLKKSSVPSGQGWIGQTPEQNPALYDLLSPIKLINSKIAPVYIIHGAIDPTVDVGQSHLLVEELKKNKATYIYKEIPDAPHTFGIYGRYGDFREELVQFLRKYLE